jgi:hypothetical protein
VALDHRDPRRLLGAAQARAQRAKTAEGVAENSCENSKLKEDSDSIGSNGAYFNSKL